MAFSIGVIHHLERPVRALEVIVRAVKPGGRVLIWVYGRENNRWLVSVLGPLRRVLFSRLPIGVTHHLSLYPAMLVWLLMRLGIRPIAYFRLIGKFDFAHLRAIVFDQMLPRIAHYWPRETVARMMLEAGLVDIRLTWVNQMSWSGDRHASGIDEEAANAVHNPSAQWQRRVSSGPGAARLRLFLPHPGFQGRDNQRRPAASAVSLNDGRGRTAPNNDAAAGSRARGMLANDRAMLRDKVPPHRG